MTEDTRDSCVEREWASMTEYERAVWAACVALDVKDRMQASQDMGSDMSMAVFWAGEVIRGLRQVPEYEARAGRIGRRIDASIPLTCPWCGAEPEVGPHHIACVNPRCAAKPRVEDSGPVVRGGEPRTAIRNWNWRAYVRHE